MSKKPNRRNPKKVLTQATGKDGSGAGGMDRRRFLKLSAAGVGLAAAGSIFKWPEAFAQGAQPVTGGILDYAMVSVDERFDPAQTTFTSVSGILNHVTETLVVQMEPGSFVSNLAESWEVSPDATQFTFNLRQGVSFTDGTPFNAEAVKFTFDRVVSPTMTAGLARNLLGPYESTEVIDEFTVRIVMSAPFAPFLNNVAQSYLGIVSPTAVQEMGDAGFLFNPVGTGPLMWQDFVSDSHIELVRNPNYTGASGFFQNLGPSYLDSVFVRIIPSGAVRLGALGSGEVQYIERVDPLGLEQLQADPSVDVVIQEQNGIPHSLLMNMDIRNDTGQPPMTAELAVRQAVAFAIDRESLTESVYGATGKTAWNFISPLSWAYDEEAASAFTYDPERARQILDEAGWVVGGDGFRTRDGERLTFDLVFRARRDEPRSEVIQASLREVGIDCRLRALEAAAQRAAVQEHNYEGVYTWEVSSDPDVLSTIGSTGGVYNRSLYSDAQVDAWLSEANALGERADRAPLYAQVQRKLMEDCIGVPLVHSFLANAKRDFVMDVAVDGSGATTHWRDAWLDQ